MIYQDAVQHLPDNRDYHISQNEVKVELPVRVNWGGGWTDTPPHCNEKGGVVLNAAIKLKGIYPVQVCMACQDLICGQFISGAGGGGFLQVILKKGVTKETLRARIRELFQDSGVDVWDCEILF